ncbi:MULTISPECIES: ABC transporter substrate-binding protein [Microbacterium]|uniref:ABC transporter substrate-binding protein n=1 Tax=Microbacterium TaxID=33882 RepID=UPI00217DAD1D|nr:MULTISPECIES: extracellular solute-binding protein [Microbacterium]UWF77128.1 extracellular solute-binding protein [Microbacterium neungamense]WCM55289.1 extracellular solute-binding protein [Microbacterium sp. EF45047]
MSISKRRMLLASLAVPTVLGVSLVGCAEADTGGGGGDGEQTVRISGGITGTEADDLNESFAAFEEETGINVEYTGDKSFEGNIVTKVTGGDAPDIAIVPQPGLLKTLVDTGKVVPAPESVEKAVDENWSEAWKDIATFDDTFYAAPMLANLKGYIWYQPAKFQEWGVEVPKTWDELITLTETIREKTGQPPWCAGFASGDASGWPGTDWIEDLVLRQAGPEVYDQWAAGEVEFTDPKIKEAFDAVGSILLNPEYVNAGFGDVKSINSTAFADVAAKIADGTCALTHQASFLSANFLDVKNADGETPTVAPDGDVYAFITPGMTEGELQVSGGGEFVAAFNDDEATQQVLEFMTTPEFADARVELGGVISANKKADPSLASSEFLQESMAILQDESTTFRFDASDLMPSTVGSGSFWKGMVDWIDGKPTEQVLSDIQAGYEN